MKWIISTDIGFCIFSVCPTCSNSLKCGFTDKVESATQFDTYQEAQHVFNQVVNRLNNAKIQEID